MALSFPNLSPYSLVLKVVAIAGAGLLLLLLVMSWMARGQEIHRLTDWQNGVVISATDATVLPGKDGKRKLLDPSSVPAAIAGLKRSYDSAAGAIEAANQSALIWKQRSDNADKALAGQITMFDQQYASAEKRIAALANRPPAATPDLQCKAIVTDTQAPWEAWK